MDISKLKPKEKVWVHQDSRLGSPLFKPDKALVMKINKKFVTVKIMGSVDKYEKFTITTNKPWGKKIDDSFKRRHIISLKEGKIINKEYIKESKLSMARIKLEDIVKERSTPFSKKTVKYLRRIARQIESALGG